MSRTREAEYAREKRKSAVTASQSWGTLQRELGKGIEGEEETERVLKKELTIKACPKVYVQ